MNVIITGSTGMVGKGVLLECLDDPRITSILVVNRQTIDLRHPKLKEVLVKDFMKLETIASDLSGYDTCFFCAGTSSIGKTEEQFNQITYEVTVHFAKAFLQQNKESSFSYVSGTGTDSSEKGKVMWARVKGKTENTIIKMGFNKTYMFRPGYIQPLRGIKSKTGWYNIPYMIFKPIYHVLKFFPNTATSSVNLGKAMINLTVNQLPSQIVNSKEINQQAISPKK